MQTGSLSRAARREGEPTADREIPALAPRPLKRRLAAIASAGFAGFAWPCAGGDVAAQGQWKLALSDTIEPSIRAHRGELLRVGRGAILVEFISATDAVRWAVAMRLALAAANASPGDPCPELRIGINVDDVIVDENGPRGDGVDLAMDIHETAAPGDIVVTAAVRVYVRNRLDVEFEDLGEHRLTTIAHPVHLARVAPRPADGSDARARRPEVARAKAPRRAPTVEVDSFRNLAGSTVDDRFGAGLGEDIAAALARSKTFHVIGADTTAKDGGSDDGPRREEPRGFAGRYLLRGNVRRRGGLLRVSARLVDAAGDLTLWAGDHDGASADLIARRGSIVASIAAGVEARVLGAEIARAEAKPLANLDAYDCVLRSILPLQRIDDARWPEAAALLERAIELDPSNARAHAYRAWLHLLVVGEAMSTDVAADRARARVLSDRAVELGPDDPFVLAVSAHVHSFLLGQHGRAMVLVDRAIRLNDACALAWGVGALAHGYGGEPDAALAHFGRARAAAPADPLTHIFLSAAAMAAFARGGFFEAVRWAQEALRWNPRYLPAHRHLVAALAKCGRADEASASARDLLALRPGFRVAALACWYPLHPRASLDLYLHGLCKAGLPP